MAYFPAQGNDPSCTRPGCNIGMICKVMTDTAVGDEVTRLAKLTKRQSSWIAPKWSDEARRQVRGHEAFGSCALLSGRNDMRIFRVLDCSPGCGRQEELEISVRAKSGLYANYWGYQTCTEFAFYQTCEVGSKCFFVSLPCETFHRITTRLHHTPTLLESKLARAVWCCVDSRLRHFELFDRNVQGRVQGL